jgi:dTMP kinase
MTKIVEKLKGKLIAVEGLDGSGKSTQIYLLHQWLKALGYRVYFSEWNSSVLVKESTKKGKKKQLLTPTTFSLIHATDFADRYERQMLPLLRAGYIVLCDRYMFTAFARDSVRGCSIDWLENLYSFAIIPDITLYFRLPLETALGRILEGRPQLKYFEAGMDLDLSGDAVESFKIFQGRIMKQYETLADKFNFTVLDATKDIHFQQEIVRNLVKDRIDLSFFHKGAPR